MTFLYLSSDRMGMGDDELGRRLLRSFLIELASTDQKIDFIGCVNHGVLLTTEGSQMLDALKTLEDKGARIASCGTCLDALGIREKLQIGMVGSMAQSVQIMMSAERIIRP